MDFNFDTETIISNTGDLTIQGTGALFIPTGTDGQRPVSPSNGYIRFNTTQNILEFWYQPTTQWLTFGSTVLSNVSNGNAGGLKLLNIPVSTYTTVQEFVNILGSRGTFSGGVFTDNGDGTIAISAGTGMIHSADSTLSDLYFFNFASVSSLALTNNALNWIYINYNAGAPAIVAQTSQTFDKRFILLGQVYRAGTTITLNNITRLKIDNSIAGIVERFEATSPYQRQSGAIISATGTRNFAITAGAFWEGIDLYTSTAKDTSATDTFTYWYRTAPTTWTSVAAQTQISNTQYNDPTSGLVNLSNNRFGVHWVYLGTNGSLNVVYGITNLNLADSQDTQPPPNPPNPLLTAVLIGRIIIQRNASTFAEVQSAFDKVFIGGATSIHNELGGLQGGIVDEYFHTTLTENTNVVNVSALGTGIVAKTSATAYAARTITAGSTKISISNGDGVSNNPTVDAVEANFTLNNIGGTLGIAKGGTNLTATPTNGQLLIGNGTGYTLATLATTTGISVTNASGSITINNTGVTSAVAGTGISVSGATGAVTFSNTGVLTFSAGTTGLTPSTPTSGAVTLAGTLIAANGGTGFNTYVVGDLLFANTTTTLARLAGVATGNALISGGIGVAPSWGKIGLTTHVTGTLPIANGGTNLTATPTNGQLLIGNGTGYTLATITAGTGVSVTNGAGTITLANTGVTSIAGTANQITASAATGAVTLSVPSTFIAPGSVQVTTTLHETQSTAVTAAGATQGTATALTSVYNVVTTVAAGTGVILPTPTSPFGHKVTVLNRGANPLNLYPNTGANIAGAATNAAIVVPVNQEVTVFTVSATQWWAQEPIFIAGTNVTLTPGPATLTLASTGGGTPAAPTTSIQFNNAGVFGGSANNTWDNTNNIQTINGAAASNRLTVNTDSTVAIDTAQRANAAVYIQVSGDAQFEGQRVYFRRSTAGISGWITYDYDINTPNIRIIDEDDDPPYVAFQTIGTGTFASPLYTSVFGARGTYSSRTGGAQQGFAWYAGQNTTGPALITANNPIMQLDPVVGNLILGNVGLPDPFLLNTAAGDSLIVTTGAAATTTSTGETVTVRGGAGGTTSGAGGAVTVTGGIPTAGAGGAVTVSGAAGVGTNQNGGDVTLAGGAATGTGIPGFINLSTGIELTGIITPTDATNQNDYAPTGLNGASVIRWNGTASIKFTGLAGGVNGRIMVIRNATTQYLLWLEHENTASAAANRFNLPNGFPAFLCPDDAIWLVYSSAISRWQVLSWPSQGQAMGLTYFTDLIEGTTGGLTSTVSGTGASVQVSTYLVNTTERPMGVTQIDTGTTATGRSTLGFAGTAGIVPTLGFGLSVVRLAVETTVSGTETFQLISGFADSAGGTFTDGVAWNNRWNGAAAEWSQDRLAGGVATRTAVGSPTPDNNYIWLVVFVNPAWTRADFIFSTDSVSFSVAGSQTTGLPNNTQYTGWVAASMIKSVGTTQRNCSIDLAGYRMDYVRG